MAHRSRSAVVVTSMIALLIGCKSEPAAQPAAVTVTPPTVTPPSVVTRVTPAPAPRQRPPAAAAPVTRPTITTIRSAPASLDQMLAGRKTSTTRKGVRQYPLGFAVVVDGRRQVAVTITRIDPKRFADLTAGDAASDGAESLSALRASLVRFNPGLTDDDIVSVVHFKVNSAATSMPSR